MDLANIKQAIMESRLAEQERKQIEEQMLAMAETEYLSYLRDNDITLFHDNFLPKIHPASLVVLAALSGSGKSSWGIQAAVHALNQGFKVLFFSNELNGIVLKDRIRRNIRGKIEYYKNLIVVDRAVAPELKMYDKIAEYIIDRSEKVRPDLVIVDQINNALESSDINDRVPDFKRAEIPLAQLGDYVCSPTIRNYGARFIVLQQALGADLRVKPEMWQVMNLLRGAKNTYTHATHVFYVAKQHMKDGTIQTIMVVDKVRYPDYKYQRVSYWQMENGLFVPKAQPVDEKDD